MIPSNGCEHNLIKQLCNNGLISKITDECSLSSRLEKPITLYCGFDPTADSLHLGHIVPLLCMKRFQQLGHKPIILIGGATGLIGDPSFRDRERALDSNNIDRNIDKIKNQVKLFLDFNCGNNSAVIVNNYEWFKKLNVISYLREIGKYFSIKSMINRKIVRERIKDNKSISYAEFSYNLLQSYDFVRLNKNYNAVLQIGGSDQWGNITSGVNLVRRLSNKQVWGLTVPLVTRSNGTKFSKTDSNTIWLDAKKTSPYEFYQFWINTTDNDVYKFLNLFTLLTLDEVNNLKKYIKNSRMSKAQVVLADQVTRLVHGDNNLNNVKFISSVLFSRSDINLTKINIEEIISCGIPTVVLRNEDDFQQVLIRANLAVSRGHARTLIISGAISINGIIQTDVKYQLTAKDIKLSNKFVILCRGKKHYCLGYW